MIPGDRVPVPANDDAVADPQDPVVPDCVAVALTPHDHPSLRVVSQPVFADEIGVRSCGEQANVSVARDRVLLDSYVVGSEQTHSEQGHSGRLLSTPLANTEVLLTSLRVTRM